jgi:hypothetical protein
VKVNEMFPNRYVTGADLQGRAVTVTIKSIEAQKMRPNQASPEVERYVLYTVEGKKGVILSKVLATQIAKAVGSDDTKDWAGKRITFFPEAMTVAGQPRTAIRARAAVLEAQKEEKLTK